MEKSELTNGNKLGAVFEAVQAVMRDIGSIGKDNTNKHQNYQFRSVDQAMGALQPLLVKHGLVLELLYSDPVIHPGEKGFSIFLGLDFNLVSVVDGSESGGRFYGQGYDPGDKALYKAKAGALKYAIYQTFMIPVGDRMDVEYHNEETTSRTWGKR